MIFQLIRHSTMIVTMRGANILVDPMLAPARSTDPINNTPNQKRNPLVELPFDHKTLLATLETIKGVIVTHLHNDHWDVQARELLPKSLPIFCQPEDQQRIEGAGFQAVHPIREGFEWQGIRLSRTGGQHGRGEIGQLMAPVSGFVLQSRGEPTVYIAGDTIWCSEVEQAIRKYQPAVIIVNAGAAQFMTGGPITMPAEDVIKVAKSAPEATLITVHMEAINHCLLSRSALIEALIGSGVATQVRVPKDGDQITLTSPLEA
jgi:L-ascorbate metabolism protein UlaG (beta-lactamase superfamily)